MNAASRPVSADRPAEQQLEHECERVEVDAGDEDGRDREGDRVEQVRTVPEAPEQVLGDAADLRPVVEGHHHEPQEDHRRDRADPVEVHAGDAVLGAVRGLSEQLERAEVRGDERDAGDPRRQRAAGEEVVEAGLDLALRAEADPEDDDEVDEDDRVVDRVRVQPDHQRWPYTFW
jgi:hypothetical protein